MTDGEVAVRQNGQEHAVSADALDDQILADLDGDPVLHVPPEIGVVFHDDEDEELAADGAGVDRTEVEMRGFSMPEDAANGSMVVGCALLFASGMTFSSELALAIAGLVGGGMLIYLGARSAWSGRS